VEISAALLGVEALGEGLQIDIGCVEVTIELCARRWHHVAGRDRHGTNIALVAGLGHIDGVLKEDNRIVVGHGHALAATAHGRSRDGIRGGDFTGAFYATRAAGLPVLAKLAREIATRGAEGQHGRPWEEMEQGFFSIGSMQNPVERP